MRIPSAERPPTMQELLIVTRDLRAAKVGSWDSRPAVTFLTSPSKPPRRVPIPGLVTHDGTLPDLPTLADLMAPIQQDIQLYDPPLAALTCPTDKGQGMILKIYVRGKAPRIFRFTADDLKVISPDNAHTWKFFELNEDPLPVDLFPIDPRKTLTA